MTRNDTAGPTGGGSLRRPSSYADLIVALIVAQVPVLLASVEIFTTDAQGSTSAGSFEEQLGPGLGAFGTVFSFGFLPALVAGALYGLVRRAQSEDWRVFGRLLVAVLFVVLGVFVALVGTIYATSYGDQGPKAAPLPVPFGVYLGALVGMEATLALSCGMAWLVAPKR